MKEKKHKCRTCGKVRLDRYMVADSVWDAKSSGKQMVRWQCGDCEEENRGKKKLSNTLEGG